MNDRIDLNSLPSLQLKQTHTCTKTHTTRHRDHEISEYTPKIKKRTQKLLERKIIKLSMVKDQKH